mmetsp:Transcript_30675/g.74905  ORF Transcript_30675/g.74905 Transcript_30675/m.74905 type:complete len:268 (-) Transcript_30675:10-813(-)
MSHHRRHCVDLPLLFVLRNGCHRRAAITRRRRAQQTNKRSGTIRRSTRGVARATVLRALRASTDIRAQRHGTTASTFFTENTTTSLSLCSSIGSSSSWLRRIGGATTINTTTLHIQHSPPPPPNYVHYHYRNHQQTHHRQRYNNGGNSTTTTTWTIGRHAMCDVCVKSLGVHANTDANLVQTVSRYHATITYDRMRRLVIVKNFGSNGTAVGDRVLGAGEAWQGKVSELLLSVCFGQYPLVLCTPMTGLNADVTETVRALSAGAAAT